MSFRVMSTMVLCAGLLAPAPAQTPGTTKDDEDVVKAGREDPFTKNDPKAMEALGVLSYGPLPWADSLRTTDLEKVLGEGRILWLETAHFRIGCNLGTTQIPADPDARKQVTAELQQLRKKWSKMPSRASKLEPWLRLHLYALRAETLYADFASLVAHTDKPPSCLGQDDKFLILLFQRKSDLARYLDRFCGVQSTQSMRHYHDKSRQIVVAITAEGEEIRDEAQVHAQFRFLLVQSFQQALGGTPYWLSLGLAHLYEREIPTNLLNVPIKDDESVDPMTQHLWREKLRARVPRESLVIPFRDLCGSTDLGYWANLQAWSRVDYLLSLDRAKFGEFFNGCCGGFSSSRQHELLEKVYAMDADTFDERWRAWVVKTYK
ncbi:MAG: hypothetical protein ABIP94_03855 [Planctomycetota bacterium]